MTPRRDADNDANDELLHRARAGDQRAVERLLGFVRTRTVPVALRQVADQPEAEDLAQDIVQETLVRALAHLNDCRADTLGQFVSWAHAIATRVVLDERRRPFGLIADVEVRVNLEAEHHPSVEMPTLEDDADYHGITAVTLMLAAAAGAHRDAQGDVTDVVTTRILGGAPWTVIAADLGTTPGGAKRRFQRMIARLRRETLRRLGTLRAEQRASVVALMRTRGVAGWEALTAADRGTELGAGCEGSSRPCSDPTETTPTAKSFPPSSRGMTGRYSLDARQKSPLRPPTCTALRATTNHPHLRPSMTPRSRKSTRVPTHDQPSAAGSVRYATSYERNAQHDSDWIEEQFAIDRHHAEQDGFLIPDEPRMRFTDDGGSGAATSRGDFDRMVQIVERGSAPFERVYVRHPDRLGRWADPRVRCYYEVLFEQHDVKLRYAERDARTDE